MLRFCVADLQHHYFEGRPPKLRKLGLCGPVTPSSTHTAVPERVKMGQSNVYACWTTWAAAFWSASAKTGGQRTPNAPREVVLACALYQVPEGVTRLGLVGL